MRTAKKDWAIKCLASLAKYGNISKACADAHVGRTTFYQRRDADKDFADRAAEALETATDALELEARRRANNGVERKKFDKGQPIIDPETGEQYIEREYSDTLMIFLLKAAKPEKYRERMDVRQSGNVAILHVVEDERWFSNDAHHLIAQSAPASIADPVAPGSHEGNGVRPTLGQNGNGTNGRH